MLPLYTRIHIGGAIHCTGMVHYPQVAWVGQLYMRYMSMRLCRKKIFRGNVSMFEAFDEHVMFYSTELKPK